MPICVYLNLSKIHRRKIHPSLVINFTITRYYIVLLTLIRTFDSRTLWLCILLYKVEGANEINSSSKSILIANNLYVVSRNYTHVWIRTLRGFVRDYIFGRGHLLRLYGPQAILLWPVVRVRHRLDLTSPFETIRYHWTTLSAIIQIKIWVNLIVEHFNIYRKCVVMRLLCIPDRGSYI